MVTTEQLLERYRKLETEKLAEIVSNGHEYQQGAREAAEEILSERQITTQDIPLIYEERLNHLKELEDREEDNRILTRWVLLGVSVGLSILAYWLSD